LQLFWVLILVGHARAPPSLEGGSSRAIDIRLLCGFIKVL
jgi:hypothetical protein